jgi:hypothetical protein
MQIVQHASWQAFRSDLYNYSLQSRQRRKQWIFRGHADAAWPLQTTLDRQHKFESDSAREQFVQEMLLEFRDQVFQLNVSSIPVGKALELFARHQSLPSPLLDWTRSPYTATFFAFEGAARTGSERVAVWMLDLARLSENQGVDIIDDLPLLQFNVRALRQRGVFLRILTVQRPVEELLGDALVKIEMPSGDAMSALSELDEMNVNATFLFSDFEAAARTAHFLAQERNVNR